MILNDGKFREAYAKLDVFVKTNDERLAIRCGKDKGTNKRLRGRMFGFATGTAVSAGDGVTPVVVIQVSLLDGKKQAQDLFVLYASENKAELTYYIQFQDSFITQPSVVDELLALLVDVLNRKEVKDLTPTIH